MSKELWDVNSVQFPRLISEICACVEITPDDWEYIAKSMDLDISDVDELVDRAQQEWEAIKNRHCPPVKSKG